LSNGRQVFVFDVSAARVIHTINPVAAGGTRVRVAAGMHKLIVGSQRRLDRYDLATARHESRIEIDLPIADIIMGSASNGPLMATMPTGGGSLLLDPNDWRPVEPEWAGETMPKIAWISAMVSADGRTLTGREYGARPNNVVVTLQGSQARVLRKDRLGASWVPVSADGQRLFAGPFVLNSQFDRVREPPSRSGTQFTLVPSVHGDYFMQLEPDELNSNINTAGKVNFFLPEMAQPFGRLENVESVSEPLTGYGTELPAQLRVI